MAFQNLNISENFCCGDFEAQWWTTETWKDMIEHLRNMCILQGHLRKMPFVETFEEQWWTMSTFEEQWWVTGPSEEYGGAFEEYLKNVWKTGLNSTDFWGLVVNYKNIFNEWITDDGLLTVLRSNRRRLVKNYRNNDKPQKEWLTKKIFEEHWRTLGRSCWTTRKSMEYWWASEPFEEQ